MTQPAVVVFALIPWRHLFQRPQQMVAHWPSDQPIIYVEPLTLQAGNALWPERTDYGWRLSLPLLPHGAKNERVRRVSGWIGSVPLLRRLLEGMVRLWLAVLWRLAGLPPVGGIVIESPQYAPFLQSFPGSRVLFDYMDDLLEFAGIPPYFRDFLAEVQRNADVVVATSQPLAKKLRAFHDRPVEVIGNGVDVGHFRPGQGRAWARPEAWKGRVLVYAGTLGYWIDFDWLEALAEACPDDTIALFGPVYGQVQERFDALQRRRNVWYGGTVPYPELPSRLAHTDVGLIPFLENELTLAVNPNKAYEYAAMGIPFVSRWLPPLEEFEGLVPLVRSQEAFVSGARELLDALGTDAHEERLQGLAAIARRNSWQEKMATLAARLHGEATAGA